MSRPAVALVNSPKKRGASIGNRWTPVHIVRADTEAGTYEEINAPAMTLAESLVQRALLAKPEPSLLSRILSALRG